MFYTVGHKKRDTVIFFDNSNKYWPIFVIFFTAIYNNELQNKNVLKFSPHLKSVAALPCETWNVKCTTRSIRSSSIQNWLKMSSHSTNIQFKSIYIRCSKWPPCARTQAVSHARHWSISSSMTFCPMLSHTHSTGADTTRRRHLRVSRRPTLALQPRSYNPRGSHMGCLGATGREK